MKTLFPPFRDKATRTRPLRWALAALSAVLLCSTSAQAQFPRVESFKNTTTAGVGFRLGGNPNSAVLTAANGTDIDGTGYLRLTNNSANEAGFAIDNQAFPAPTGFAISFEFFSYGGTGADGFSVFLVDADKTSAAAFTAGASGGSLGYAQKTVDPISNGVPNGYIGIGIDEFGNYANPTEGRVGGRTAGADADGKTPDAVSIRGAGNGRSATDYPYIAGSPTLPFSLDVTTVRAQVGSDDFRRAYIYLIPQADGTYQITTRIQYGNSIITTTDRVKVPKPPNNLRIGFAGSTGGSTNFHEIRNLAIVQAPIANDDVASTVYGVPVSLNVLNNDVAQGSNILPSSVDLDPTTAAFDDSFTIAGKGTFTRGTNGVVTFAPVPTFAGVVTIPYTVSSVAGDLSNPANITIIVKGADVTTSVSGPTAASPGSTIIYFVSTNNLGTETANNVVPTIKLPTGLTNVVVSDGIYTSSTGLVTFATVPSLAANAAAIVNSVQFTAPASGSVTGLASVTSDTPDPVLTNNTATIKTIVQGNANVATNCATPGKDGPGELNATTPSPNTYYPGGATTVMSATSLQVGTPVGATPISAGDLLLIIQVQGADINTDNDSKYGDGMAGGSGGQLTTNFSAGYYEYAVAASAVASGTLTLTKPLSGIYERVDFTSPANPTGQRRFQVVRIPQYSSLTVTGTVTGEAWNGETGGVLALDVTGRTTFAVSGRLDMSGKGFRGGGARQYTGGGTSYDNNDFRNVASTTTTGRHGAKGEGWAGTPRFVWNGSALLDTGFEGYRNGSVGRGGAGNAGGGATDNLANNTGNAGGAGGGNAGAGGRGGYNQSGTGAQAAAGSNFAGTIGRWFLGGGGGAGSTEQAGTESSGGVGGGIVVLRTGYLSGTGELRANGGNAPTADQTTNYTNGGGGGGAGGVVVLLSTNTSGFNGMTLSAAGGTGGNARTGSTAKYGPGGGGGGGFVFANSNKGTEIRSGGTSGRTANGTTTNGVGNGATGTVTLNATAPSVLIGGSDGCLPALSVALSTSTPSVQRIGGPDSSVNPALYTLTIANTGGQADNVRALTSMASNIFQFDPTFTPVVQLQRADGSTTSISTTVPTTELSTPEFGDASLSIPAGATLLITFRATIATAAEEGFAYQANATVTYNNPFRTTVATTTSVSPSSNYAGGTDATFGAAGGSNYSASFSTNEDVTIIARPLPVTLTAFAARATGRDALLTWTTATELNNDRFELERSVDGVTFETIGSQRGQGTTTSTTDYRYVDAGAARFSAKLLYYRLRQVDIGGHSSYSHVQTVRFERRKATAGLYPNPQQGQFTLDLLDLPEGTYQVEILDLAGRRVLKTQLNGGLAHPMLLPTLPQGSYIVRVSGQTVNISLHMTRN